MPQLSNQFWALIEPVMNRDFIMAGKNFPEQFSKLFNVSSTKESQRSALEVGGVGVLVQKNEGAAVQIENVTQGTVKNYDAVLYAIGTAFSHEAAEDTGVRGQGKILTAMGSMGRAVKITPERIAALYMDDAFNSSGNSKTPDGVELCGTHILPSGTTSSNELATPAALDESTAEEVRVALRGILDVNGNKMPSNIKNFVVPSALEPIASKIQRTKQSLGNANNDENLSAGLDHVVLDYLASSTKWFVKTDAVTTADQGLFWQWREKARYVEDPVPQLLAKVFIAYFRSLIGCVDWRDIFGVEAT